MNLILDLHHVSLLVTDIDRSLAFYCGLLGLSLDPARPQLGYPGAWLQVGGRQIHLLQLPNPDAAERRPAHGGRDRHIALLVKNLELLTGALDAAGIAYTRSASGRQAVFCRDPDQNALELVQAAADSGLDQPIPD